jgi:hypothetical protein
MSDATHDETTPVETSTQSADWFATVHQFIRPVSTDERRGRLRQNYPTVQMIAPYINGALPERDAFRPVQCQDLSTGGFSFYLSEPPQYDRLVVALSNPSQTIFLTAAIVHYSPVAESDEPLYLCGCRFLGRIVR